MIDFVTTGCTKITSTAATSATAPIPLDSAGTVPKFVVFKSTATGYVRISEDGSAATNADVMITPGDSLRMCTNRRSFVSFVADSGNASLQVEPLEFGGYQLADALAILAKYSADAHVYLPGVGTINGLTAANYLDSAGTTAATVDNPVGLSLDALQAMTLGGELWSDSGVTVGSGWAQQGSVYTHTSGGGIDTITKAIGLVTGKRYQTQITIAGRTAGGVYVVLGGDSNGTTRTTNGVFVQNVLSGTNNYFYLQPTSDFDGAVNINSVREIPGIHASQATTANKPILRLSGGKYSWQFDGVNDSLSLGAPLFQMSDDHAVIAGVSIASFATWNGVFINGATVADFSPGIWVQGTSPGKIRAEWASTVIDSASAVTLNQPFVVSALARGSNVYARANAVQFGTTTKPGGTNATVASIGSLNGATDFCNGRIYPVIAIKGTVTDSDLLTLERWVGQLSGVSI